MTPAFFHVGGAIMTDHYDMLDSETVDWLAKCLADEFHGAIKAPNIQGTRIVDLARRVDQMNVAIDQQRAWMRAGRVQT